MISSFVKSSLTEANFNGYSLSNSIVKGLTRTTLGFEVDELQLDQLYSLSRYVFLSLGHNNTI